MKIKIALSMLVILFVIALSLGATMAWFTAESSIEENIFTAGTLMIEAGESWEDDYEVENWNPGDCEEKEVTVEVTGSKSAYIRMQFDDGWYEEIDGSWVSWTHSNDVDPIKIRVVDEDNNEVFHEFPTDDWVEDGGWYYYVGGDMEGYLASGATITVISQVCLDGPTADNEFQGKQYRLGFIFEAIQTSNYAAYYEWGVDIYGEPPAE